MPPATPADAYELTDILVEEIALVDRPANQRKSLVIKNLKRVSKDAEDLAEPPETPGEPPDAEDLAEPPEPPPAPGLEMTAASKGVVMSVLMSLGGKVADLIDMVKGSAEKEGMESMIPKDVSDGLMALVDNIDAFGKMYKVEKRKVPQARVQQLARMMGLGESFMQELQAIYDQFQAARLEASGAPVAVEPAPAPEPVAVEPEPTIDVAVVAEKVAKALESHIDARVSALTGELTGQREQIRKQAEEIARLRKTTTDHGGEPEDHASPASSSGPFDWKGNTKINEVRKAREAAERAAARTGA